MTVSIVVANYIDDTTFCAATEDDDDAPAPQRRRIDAAVEDVARQWGDEPSPVQCFPIRKVVKSKGVGNAHYIYCLKVGEP